MMEFKIKRIHLTALDSNEEEYDPKSGNTDVIVSLENDKKYIASFFTYENIRILQDQHKKNGVFLDGTYFWDKHMVLVEECSLKSIETVVGDLIDEGNFREAFREL